MQENTSENPLENQFRNTDFQSEETSSEPSFTSSSNEAIRFYLSGGFESEK